MKTSRNSFCLPLRKLVFACALATGASTQAAVSFSITDSVGAPNSVTIAPGDSFSFTLTFNSTAEITNGLSYFLETLDAAASSKFRLTTRNNTSSPFSDYTTTDSIALQSGNALLDPKNDNDLGVTSTADVGTGNSFVASYTVQSLASLAPGSYTIETSADSTASEAVTFASLPMSVATYNVTVVPEPGSAALLVLGGLPLVLHRRRPVNRG